MHFFRKAIALYGSLINTLLSLGAIGMEGGLLIPKALNGQSLQFPSAVSFKIYESNTKHLWQLCSGCRVSENQILTADHCLNQKVTPRTKIELLSSGGVLLSNLSAKSFIRSGVCGRELCSDIGIVELSPSLHQSKKIKRHIAQARIQSNGVYPGQTLFLTGAGCKKPTYGGCKEQTLPYHFQNKNITYKQVSVDEHGYFLEFAQMVGAGTRAYAQVEHPHPLLGPGDSGGCVYDMSGAVVAVNSHVWINPITGYSYNHMATLRSPLLKKWLTQTFRDST